MMGAEGDNARRRVVGHAPRPHTRTPAAVESTKRRRVPLLCVPALASPVSWRWTGGCAALSRPRAPFWHARATPRGAGGYPPAQPPPPWARGLALPHTPGCPSRHVSSQPPPLPAVARAYHLGAVHDQRYLWVGCGIAVGFCMPAQIFVRVAAASRRPAGRRRRQPRGDGKRCIPGREGQDQWGLAACPSGLCAGHARGASVVGGLLTADCGRGAPHGGLLPLSLTPPAASGTRAAGGGGCFYFASYPGSTPLLSVAASMTRLHRRVARRRESV